MAEYIDTKDFGRFARDLRATSPLLGKRFRSKIGKVGRAAATKMRAEVPHQDSTGRWGPQKGVRFSDALSSNGGAIVIDHLAHTFGVGNRGVGKFKHKVYGKWSSSAATIEPTSDFIEKGWAEVGTALEIAADEVLQETVEELARGE